MNDISLKNAFSIHEMEQIVSVLTPDQIKHEVENISLEHVPLLTSLFKNEKLINWKDKFLAFFLGLKEKKEIMLFAQNLDIEQLKIVLLNQSLSENDSSWKIYSLFIGLPQRLFNQIILEPAVEIQDLLKKEGITEPIQHHLNLLSHELSQAIFSKETDLEQLQNEILKIDLKTEKLINIKSLQQRIKGLCNDYRMILNLVEKALGITWNTNRTDLIEKFTWIKEHAQKALSLSIGHFSDGSIVSESLYSLLKKKIDDFYSDVEDILEDDDLAIEALPKFSIWYFEDYSEVGLIPKKARQKKVQEKDWVTLQPTINEEVKEYLKDFGINTVKDLKDLFIFSRESLKEYIQSHKLKQ